MEIFQSYDSKIVMRNFKTGKIILDKMYWNYSQTTNKYRNQFLEMTSKEIQKNIDSGIFTLENLN